ncbi:MAG: tail fiber protein [Magnetococcales bacterium]|nr:tail fiber protein [Magnetococcales bacterium]MBF0150746.1 tail fiber protein [Magnetococcales bacterium]MBF0175170.1 tail fiber protein [Magnetococcales bacterium]MBF0346026.1 tail fiber protein [Magnetococcales bacterium]MBF0631836.1 tail fiber protein [Magnetococcales bacterium]
MSTILPWPSNRIPSGFSLCNGTLLTINQYYALYSLLGVYYGGDAKTTFGLPDLRGRGPFGVSSGSTDFRTLGFPGGKTSAMITAFNLPVHTHNATFQPTQGSQTITFPATPQKGAITAKATTDIVPGSPGSVDPVANQTYNLTGVAAPANGPVTTTAVDPTNKATLQGTNVVVDTSTYQPAIPALSTTISTVTSGTVTVAQGGGSTNPSAIPTLPPYLTINFIIALQGNYPMPD